MSAPNWARVLRQIYSDEGNNYAPIRPHNNEIHDNHKLIEDAELSKEEVQNALHFLDRNGLITNVTPTPKDAQRSAMAEDPFSGKSLGLTPEGFNIAHERGMKRTEMLHNFSIYTFTIVLAGAAVSRIALKVFPEIGELIFILSIFGFLMALGFTIIASKITGGGEFGFF